MSMFSEKQWVEGYCPLWKEVVPRCEIEHCIIQLYTLHNKQVFVWGRGGRVMEKKLYSTSKKISWKDKEN